MTIKEKYEIVIKNWESKSKKEIAKMIGVSEAVVAFMVGEARKNGVDLVDKRTEKYRIESGRSVDWKKVKK